MTTPTRRLTVEELRALLEIVINGLLRITSGFMPMTDTQIAQIIAFEQGLTPPSHDPEGIALELDEIAGILHERREATRYGQNSQQRHGYRQGLYDAAAIVNERRTALAGPPAPMQSWACGDCGKDYGDHLVICAARTPATNGQDRS